MGTRADGVEGRPASHLDGPRARHLAYPGRTGFQEDFVTQPRRKKRAPVSKIVLPQFETPQLDDTAPESWLDPQPERYVVLEITRTLSDVPDQIECSFCDGQASSTYLSYEIPLRETGVPTLAVFERVPGYACASCQIEVYDPHAIAEALRVAYVLACSANDAPTVDYIESLLAAGQR